MVTTSWLDHECRQGLPGLPVNWLRLIFCTSPYHTLVHNLTGYYMAMGATHIVAEPLTITGSIGVVTGKFSLERLFERVGFNQTTISRWVRGGRRAREWMDRFWHLRFNFSCSQHRWPLALRKHRERVGVPGGFT